ncbi:MAG: helix-turn-helix transcriptional regulator [Cyanobacteria bacterium P01_F01_bin.3]
MSQIPALISALKRELKARGFTYAQVARQLDVSESSVKRLFSQTQLSVSRLEQLCHLLDLEISDLVQKMSEERNRIAMLTAEQEREVVKNPRLLLMAISVLNNWTYEDITHTYLIEEHECIQLLAALDKLEIIELLPGNRLKLMVAKEFRWIPGGPVQQFFREQVQSEFLASTFAGPGDLLLFRSGMLSRASNAVMQKKMQRLLTDFDELHDQDAGMPLQDRFGSSLLIALRPWELSIFNSLRKNRDEKPF